MYFVESFLLEYVTTDDNFFIFQINKISAVASDISIEKVPTSGLKKKKKKFKHKYRFKIPSNWAFCAVLEEVQGFASKMCNPFSPALDNILCQK